jgi:hypothetical protein
MQMRIIGLREKVIEAVNRVIALEGGYVDQDRVKQLSDKENLKDKEEITITLVFQKENRCLAQYIERCVQQAIHNPYNYQDCQHGTLSLLQDSLVEAVQKSVQQFAEKQP